MSIKEKLEEIIASVLYSRAISEEGLVENIADSIMMTFSIGPDYLLSED